jgi:hypothetical protein
MFTCDTLPGRVATISCSMGFLHIMRSMKRV